MKDRELIIKKFVDDEYRPQWMIVLMGYIRDNFPFKNFYEMIIEESLQWIENAIKKVDFWNKGEIRKVTERANYIIEGNKITVFSVKTGKPMCEYEIKEV